MLEVAHIRENREAFAKALSKRNIDAATLLDQVIAADLASVDWKWLEHNVWVLDSSGYLNNKSFFSLVR